MKIKETFEYEVPDNQDFLSIDDAMTVAFKNNVDFFALTGKELPEEWSCYRRPI